jgi:hypothetical protein
MLWGVTAYFNPAGYRSRRDNYRNFRKCLKIPLVAVEMSPTGRFELGSEDAEILVQLTGGDVLWQKERLLNVALQHLPVDCDLVAWLDCDVVFEDHELPARARAALETYSLVQLFSERCDLPRAAAHDLPNGSAVYFRAPARGYKIATGQYRSELETYRSGIFVEDYSTPGLAWAARRSLLERHGLYDARIVGGGDVAIQCAALGEFDHFFDTHAMNRRQIEHYRKWGEPFFAEVAGKIGYISGRIFHLWHGDLNDRQYTVRQRGLLHAGFDPSTDIAVDATGCWRWSSDKPELHRYVRGYFAVRNEDGPLPAVELSP